MRTQKFQCDITFPAIQELKNRVYKAQLDQERKNLFTLQWKMLMQLANILSFYSIIVHYESEYLLFC